MCSALSLQQIPKETESIFNSFGDCTTSQARIRIVWYITTIPHFLSKCNHTTIIQLHSVFLHLAYGSSVYYSMAFNWKWFGKQRVGLTDRRAWRFSLQGLPDKWSPVTLFIMVDVSHGSKATRLTIFSWLVFSFKCSYTLCFQCVLIC